MRRFPHRKLFRIVRSIDNWNTKSNLDYLGKSTAQLQFAK